MVTIKDIAKQAGVTPSTVSRVLNQSGGYSDKTRQKVLQIAAELHYQKNEAASNLVAQTSNVVGVLITNATTSFAAPIIDGIEDWAYQHGIRILLAHCGLNDAARLKACLDLMAGQKVSGILSIGFSLCNHAMEADFSFFEAYILQLTKRILAMEVPYGTCFNVNAPCGELKGIRVARQCKGRWIKEFEKRTDPHGRDYYWMTGEFLSAETDANDTDEAWLNQGYITVVPVRIDMTDYDLLAQMKSLEV